MITTHRRPDYPAPLRAFVHFLYRLAGWQVVGEAPDYPKFVVVGAPHTSNWEFFHMLAVSITTGVKMHWLGKHTLFKPPLGWFMRAAHGVPINRTLTKNAVEQVVDVFNKSDRMVLIIAPEGTRKKVDYWKTGFYYIALGAGIPILLAFADYKAKVAGYGPVIHPSGDIEADFEIIRAFFADKVGKYPEKQGTIAIPPREKVP